MGFPSYWRAAGRVCGANGPTECDSHRGRRGAGAGGMIGGERLRLRGFPHERVQRLLSLLAGDGRCHARGIYITGAGRGVVAGGQSYPPASHPNLYRLDWQRGRTLPEFQVILITDGEGIFESEPTGISVVESGTLLFLLPDVWHRYRPHRAGGWTERWLSFNGELAHRLMDQGLICAQSAIRKAQNRVTARCAFDRLLDRIHRRPTQNSIVLSLHAMTLLATLLEVPDRRGITFLGCPSRFSRYHRPGGSGGHRFHLDPQSPTPFRSANRPCPGTESPYAGTSISSGSWPVRSGGNQCLPPEVVRSGCWRKRICRSRW